MKIRKSIYLIYKTFSGYRNEMSYTLCNTFGYWEIKEVFAFLLLGIIYIFVININFAKKTIHIFSGQLWLFLRIPQALYRMKQHFLWMLRCLMIKDKFRQTPGQMRGPRVLGFSNL